MEFELRKIRFNLTVLASATVISQGLQFAALPVISRLYDPNSFGGASVAVGISMLVSSLATGRLEFALPTTANKRESAEVAALSLSLICAVTGVFTLLTAFVWLYGCSICTERYQLPLLMLGPMAFAFAVYTLSNNALLRQKQFKHFAANKLLQGFWTAASQLGLGMIAPSSLALMSGQMLGYIAGSYKGLPRLVRSILALLRHGFGVLKRPWQQFRHFPLYLGPAALFNIASQYVPVFGFATLFGLHDAGIFSFAFRITLAPLAVIGSTISQLFAAEFRAFDEKSPEDLHIRYLFLLMKMFVAGTAFCLAIVAAIWFLSKNDVFGPQWHSVGFVSLLLLPILIVDLAIAPLGAMLAYLNRNNWQLAWDIARFLSLVAVFFATHVLSLGFETTVLLFSWVFAFGMTTHAVLIYWACRSRAYAASTMRTGVSRG